MLGAEVMVASPSMVLVRSLDVFIAEITKAIELSVLYCYGKVIGVFHTVGLGDNCARDEQAETHP